MMMASSFCFLLLSSTLIHSVQAFPAVRVGGRGLSGGRGLDVGGVRRQRRDLRLPYEEQMMSYPGVGGANSLYYQSEDWRGRGLDQALQRLVERDQRREQEEEQRAAYLSALLRLLSEAERSGLVDPGEEEVLEEEEEEEQQEEEPQGDFQSPPDYDERGRSLSRGRSFNMGPPQGAWWAHLDPQLVQTLLDRMEPELTQTLLERPGPGPGPGPGSGLTRDQDSLRRLVARLLSSIAPGNAPPPGRRARRDLSINEPLSPAHLPRVRRDLSINEPLSPAHLPRVRRDLSINEPLSPAHLPRVRRDLSINEPLSPAHLPRVRRDLSINEPLSPAHSRTRRSLDNAAPPLPSNDPPLLRVKRLEEEEEQEEQEEQELRPPAAGLQRIKRIDEEMHHGSRRRRETYDPQVLIDQILEYMRE